MSSIAVRTRGRFRGGAGLGLVAWLAGANAVLPYMLIWAAHIAIDRAVGYGLKYPGSFKDTHLGRMGKDKEASELANAG